jgi:hypothetical protein
MKRVPFLLSYLILAFVSYGGLFSPYAIIFGLLLTKSAGIGSFTSPLWIARAVVPFALIAIAYVRGKSIQKGSLIWFPIAALLLPLVPLLLAQLLRATLGPSNAPSGGSAATAALMFITTASTTGPLILHTICCVIGGRKDAGANVQGSA